MHIYGKIETFRNGDNIGGFKTRIIIVDTNTNLNMDNLILSYLSFIV
jgi:hypothetical protein